MEVRRKARIVAALAATGMLAAQVLPVAPRLPAPPALDGADKVPVLPLAATAGPRR